MSNLKRVLICLLCLALCLSVFSACAKPTEDPAAEEPDASETTDDAQQGEEEVVFTEEDWRKPVATLGDHTLDSITLSYYYWTSYSSFLNYYGGTVQQILDLYTPLNQQMYSETMTWEDYFISDALMAFKQYCTLNDLAEAEGFELSETARNTLANAEEELQGIADSMGYESVEDYLIGNYGPYADLESYLDYIHDQFVVREYTSQINTKFTFTDEEVEAYYDEHAEEYAANGIEKLDINMAKLRYIVVMATDQTDENYEFIDEKFNKMLDEWETWEDKSEEGFMAFGEKWSEEGFAQDYLEAVAPGTMNFSYFDDWCFDEPREQGDTRNYFMESGNYFFYYVGETDDVYWRSQASYDMSYDAFTSYMLEEINKYEYQDYVENIIIAQVEDLYTDQLTEEDIAAAIVEEE
ncbi:MAG: hypothetical protein E7464_04520 [Ruminococcaceae bacterium]|nr:hypothetical protein [Oscillospiraceae bacterium]